MKHRQQVSKQWRRRSTGGIELVKEYINSYKDMNCIKGCCSLKISTWLGGGEVDRRGTDTKKAGVVLYDQISDSILIVQSRGNMWGVPKGTLNNESPEEGAIREVLEETGIKLEPSDMNLPIVLYGSTYFVVNHPVCDVDIQTHVEGNDANGIGWIKIECLKRLIYEKQIKLTSHTTRLIRKLFNP
jgi:8-oxo-dGTP pyrophosphatase MutT (NUDIX family)